MQKTKMLYLWRLFFTQVSSDLSLLSPDATKEVLGLLLWVRMFLCCMYLTKKRMEMYLYWDFLLTFAKNTAHNERRLLNFSYLCNVADNPSQTWHRKRLAFSIPMNLDTHLKVMEIVRRTSLAYDSIGISILHTRVWAVSNLFIRAVQGLSVGLAIGSHFFVLCSDTQNCNIMAKITNTKYKYELTEVELNSHTVNSYLNKRLFLLFKKQQRVNLNYML